MSNSDSTKNWECSVVYGNCILFILLYTSFDPRPLNFWFPKSLLQLISLVQQRVTACHRTNRLAYHSVLNGRLRIFHCDINTCFKISSFCHSSFIFLAVYSLGSFYMSSFKGRNWILGSHKFELFYDHYYRFRLERVFR